MSSSLVAASGGYFLAAVGGGGGEGPSLRWLLLWSVGSRVLGLSSCGVHGLSCPAACGILVPRPRIELVPSALAGGFLTTGPPTLDCPGGYLILGAKGCLFTKGTLQLSHLICDQRV